MKCQGSTKSGGACRLNTEPDSTYCMWHDPAPSAALLERRQRMVVTGGAKGSAAQAESRRLRQLAGARAESEVHLETSAGRMAELKRALLAIERSGGAAIAKAGAIARLVSEARTEMTGRELEQAYDELRALVIERWPAAAAALPSKLKAVR